MNSNNQTPVVNQTQVDQLSEIDKHIRIKHHKEKNRNKTCVYGIFDYITEKEAEALLKTIKTHLGCSGIICEEIVNKKTIKLMTFSGNHINDIKNILIDKKITDASHIKV